MAQSRAPGFPSLEETSVFLFSTKEFGYRGAPTCHPVHQVRVEECCLSQEGKVFLNYQQMVEVSGSLFTLLSVSL